MKMSILPAVLALGLSAIPRPSPAQIRPADSARREDPLTLMKPWMGDLDGMIQRRRIRVLVPHSKTYYFLDRGTPHGLMVDLFKLFEDDLNKPLQRRHARVHVVLIPVSRDELLPALLSGKGDVAAANLTITKERLEEADFTEPVNRNVSAIIVTGPASEPVATVQDLSGREVYVKRSSSFSEDLERLNDELKNAGKAPVKIREAPEALETEDILEMVNAGLVAATVADDFIADFWKQVFPKLTLHRGASVRSGADTGWMIRKGSPRLKAALDQFLDKYPKGSALRNELLHRYLKSTRYALSATSREERAKFDAVVELFRKYCGQYDLDFLLMVAQGYQESRLDQKAKSAVGAIGVMQVMPATGNQMQVGDIRKMEPNIHAGVKYVRFMMDQYYADEPMDRLNKGLFTFASYNAGPARIAGLRRIAVKRGLNPNVWFGNVERIASERIGRETVTYVSNIYKYSLAYQMVFEEMEERQKALEAVEGGKTPQ